MPSNYTGNSSNAVGNTVIACPVDGDPRNAGSVNGALQALADKAQLVFEWLLTVILGTWTERTIAAINETAFAICAGPANGAVRFVAVGTNSTIYTSPDGITWTVRTSPVAGVQFNRVAWNGSLFVAVGTGSNAIITSPDGVTWTQRTSPSTASWYGVAWSGSKWCITGSDSGGTVARAATSTDGLTWTAQTPGTATGLSDVAWGNGVFVALMNQPASTTGVATSPDGVTWTARTVDPASAANGKIAFVAGVFCFGSHRTGQPPKLQTSADGATWSAYTVKATPVSFVNGYAVVSDGRSLVATFEASSSDPDLYGAIFYSADKGTTWKKMFPDAFKVSGAPWLVRDVAWGGDRFCAVGQGASQIRCATSLVSSAP